MCFQDIKINFCPGGSITREQSWGEKRAACVRPRLGIARRNRTSIEKHRRLDLLLSRQRTPQREKLHRTLRKLRPQGLAEKSPPTKEQLKASTSRMMIATQRDATSEMVIETPAKEKVTVTTTTMKLQRQPPSPTRGSVASKASQVRLRQRGEVVAEDKGTTGNDGQPPSGAVPSLSRIPLPRNHFVGHYRQCL